MHDWRQRGYGPAYGGQGGPSREALYAALQRAQQENQHLRDQASRELERLHDENTRLRRAAGLAAGAAQTTERLRLAEGELALLRQQLQATEAENERLHADTARLRAELDAARAAPPASAAPAPAAEDERVLRLVADLTNLRRRQAEELSRARRSARAELIREFVEGVDSLEQALQRLSDPDDPWHQGISGVHRQLLGTLRGAGVEPLGAVGERFSPHLHEAVGVTPHAELASDHIAAVVRPGYRFTDAEGADALIRPARVIVSA